MSVGQDVHLTRCPTFVPGLDEITSGGLFRGGTYLLAGLPGSGKTVMAAQMCVGAANAGERVVYVTLLTESHARMLANLRTFDFFGRSEVGDRLALLSGYPSLSTDGLGSLLTLIREEVQRRAATFVVVDGIALAECFSDSNVAFKRFIYDLQGIALTFNCTILLLTDSSRTVSRPEEAVVDGIFELSDLAIGPRSVRQFRILKLRGSTYLGGSHVFTIGRSGVTMFPRLEATTANLMIGPRTSEDRSSTGVQELDAMLRGGLPAASTTLLMGAPGSGKTMLSLHACAAAARLGRKVLYYSFYEAPDILIRKAKGVGLPLEEFVGNGRLQLRWRLPLEGFLDTFAADVLADLREHAPVCVVIDGIDGLRQAAAFPDRIGNFLSALGATLRHAQVSAIFTAETSNLFGPDIQLPFPDVSAAVDNIVLLRYVEFRARLRRLLSIVKVRESDYDSSIREFSISNNGITLARTFESAEAILSGTAHERPASEERPSQPADDPAR
jgi:circadian clock protein KaiC